MTGCGCILYQYDKMLIAVRNTTSNNHQITLSKIIIVPQNFLTVLISSKILYSYNGLNYGAIQMVVGSVDVVLF